jgi:hypothetical protein
MPLSLYKTEKLAPTPTSIMSGSSSSPSRKSISAMALRMPGPNRLMFFGSRVSSPSLSPSVSAPSSSLGMRVMREICGRGSASFSSSRRLAISLTVRPVPLKFRKEGKNTGSQVVWAERLYRLCKFSKFFQSDM